jgi:hypothetical protein
MSALKIERAGWPLTATTKRFDDSQVIDSGTPLITCLCSKQPVRLKKQTQWSVPADDRIEPSGFQETARARLAECAFWRETIIESLMIRMDPSMQLAAKINGSVGHHARHRTGALVGIISVDNAMKLDCFCQIYEYFLTWPSLVL